MLLITQIAKTLAIIIEFIGVIVIVAAATLALRSLILGLKLSELRVKFGEKLLLGLEFIIAGDLILAVVVTTNEDLIKLASVVVIRVILGWALKKEIT